MAHVRSNLVHIAKKSALFASFFTVLFWFGYNIFLSPILIRMAMNFIAKDVLYHSPQHGPRWWSIGLAFRLFWNTLITTALLESVHAICDQFLSKVKALYLRAVFFYFVGQAVSLYLTQEYFSSIIRPWK